MKTKTNHFDDYRKFFTRFSSSIAFFNVLLFALFMFTYQFPLSALEFLVQIYKLDTDLQACRQLVVVRGFCVFLLFSFFLFYFISFLFSRTLQLLTIVLTCCCCLPVANRSCIVSTISMYICIYIFGCIQINNYYVFKLFTKESSPVALST